MLPTPSRELIQLLNINLTASDRKVFINKYLINDKPVEVFWDDLKKDPKFAKVAENLKLTIQLGTLTNNFLPLVKEIQKRGDIKTATDLISIKQKDWADLIAASGVPKNTPGKTKKEKQKNY